MLEISGIRLLFYFIAAIISLMIFYYLVKAAVKHAIIEAKEFQNTALRTKHKSFVSTNDPYSPAQIALMARYERNEISMEEYKTEWDKLK